MDDIVLKGRYGVVGGGDPYRRGTLFRCRAEPVTFEQADAHCALGGTIVGVDDEHFPGEVACMFLHPNGPMFSLLWDHVKWYLVIEQVADDGSD